MAALRSLHAMDGATTIGAALGGAAAAMALLWFRRSRRPEPGASHGAQDPVEYRSDQHTTMEPEEAVARLESHQARAPLKIRGLLLLNLRPSEGMHHIEHAPPLGSREAVIGAIRSAAPGMSFDQAGRGAIDGVDHHLSIDLGSEEIVHAAVAEAEGDIGIDMLRTLLDRQRWRAYAPRSGVFIEPDTLDLFALPDAAPSPDPSARGS